MTVLLQCDYIHVLFLDTCREAISHELIIYTLTCTSMPKVISHYTCMYPLCGSQLAILYTHTVRSTPTDSLNTNAITLVRWLFFIYAAPLPMVCYMYMLTHVQGHNITTYHVTIPEARDSEEFESQGEWHIHSCILQFTYHPKSTYKVSERRCTILYIHVGGCHNAMQHSKQGNNI